MNELWYAKGNGGKEEPTSIVMYKGNGIKGKNQNK